MFFYNSSWVISILQACFEITHVFLKSKSRGICSQKPSRFSFYKVFRDAWWVTRIEIRVLKGFCITICRVYSNSSHTGLQTKHTVNKMHHREISAYCPSGINTPNAGTAVLTCVPSKSFNRNIFCRSLRSVICSKSACSFSEAVRHVSSSNKLVIRVCTTWYGACACAMSPST